MQLDFGYGTPMLGCAEALMAPSWSQIEDKAVDHPPYEVLYCSRKNGVPIHRAALLDR